MNQEKEGGPRGCAVRQANSVCAACKNRGGTSALASGLETAPAAGGGNPMADDEPQQGQFCMCVVASEEPGSED